MLAKHLNNARFRDLRLLCCLFWLVLSIGRQMSLCCQLNKLTTQPLLIKKTPGKTDLFLKWSFN